MYFVDRKKIGEQLQYIEHLIILLEETKEWSSSLEKKALERITHMIIEGTLDIGNGIIDGFIMRDPGSYEDIVDILTDEKVISEQVAKDWKELIFWRKPLIHDYTNVDHKALLDIFIGKLVSMKKFITSIETYMHKELGPVTAFKN